MKNQILFDYMYRIPPTHRKLKAIQNIIYLAEKNSIKILFYISPADVEFMEKYFGQDLKSLLQANISIIKSVIGEKAEFVDLSQALLSEDFDWKKEKYPNDHRTLHGQEIVAKVLSNKVRELLNSSKI